MQDNTPILFQDEHFIIVDKPEDVLSVPGKPPLDRDCLLNRLLTRFANARTVHRLDMATSGLMIFALSHEAQRRLSRLFEQRQISKEYQALIHGNFTEDEGTVDLPLIADWPNRPRQKVCFDTGKSAQTRFNVVARNTEENWTRVDLFPVTGRSHQLRVHMLSMGHPILGDTLYATGAALAASPRLCLHARRLSFVHPFTEAEMDVYCPPPF